MGNHFQRLQVPCSLTLLHVSIILVPQPWPAIPWRACWVPGLTGIGPPCSYCQAWVIVLASVLQVCQQQAVWLDPFLLVSGPHFHSPETWLIQIRSERMQGRTFSFSEAFSTGQCRPGSGRSQLVWGKEWREKNINQPMINYFLNPATFSLILPWDLRKVIHLNAINVYQCL